MKYPLHNTIARPEIPDNSLRNHHRFLYRHYYQVENKWPQFQVLFDEVAHLQGLCGADTTVVVLERAYFCGGYSLFAPFFHHARLLAVDCGVDDPGERWGKQLSWLEDERCIKWRPNFASPISNLIDIEDHSVDILFIPNVVHHEKHQYRMFQEIARVLKPGGLCSIFEGLVRELHHLPDDYIRYTPEGIRQMFREVGMDFEAQVMGSGVFDVIAYVWQQALEYLPEPLRTEKRQWFFQEHYPYLQSLDRQYPVNLEKPDKAFPLSYVVRGRVPLADNAP